MAPTVLSKMKRVKVGDRKVVVDRADRTAEAPAPRRERKPARTFAEAADAGQLKKSWKKEKKGRKSRSADANPEFEAPRKYKKDDWRQFFEKD